MQITVTIPDELAAQAQARGLVLDRRLPELLAEDLAAEAIPATPPRRSSPRDMDAFFREMAQFSDKIPALPEEAFTRESFYQDHD